MKQQEPSPVDAVRAARDWAKSLPPELRPLWLALATYYPNIFPDADTLADLIGKRSAQTKRYLRELETLGAMRTEKSYVREGGVTRARAHRTLIMPELGTSPLGEMPDWYIRAQLVMAERKAKQEERKRLKTEREDHPDDPDTMGVRIILRGA